MSQIRQQIIENIHSLCEGGVTEPVDVTLQDMLQVIFDITLNSGCTALGVVMEGTTDGGDTWYPVPVTLRYQENVSTGLTTDRDAFDDKRNIQGASFSTGAHYVDLFRHLACDLIRFRWWAVGGTFQCDLTILGK